MRYLELGIIAKMMLYYCGIRVL